MRDAPSRRSGETHSDAFATTLRTRRTPPSRPPPQPSCSMSSKPPRNNLRESVHWKSTFQKNLGIMRKTPNPPAGAPLSNVQHPARPERSRIARERSSARPLPRTRPRPNSAGGRPAAPTPVPEPRVLVRRAHCPFECAQGAAVVGASWFSGLDAGDGRHLSGRRIAFFGSADPADESYSPPSS